MRSKKPPCWPKYMIAKALKSGVTAYYWNFPTWATERGCKLHRAELGSDYGTAKKRADTYNELFKAWRMAEKDPGPDDQDKAARVGTIDWVIAQFQASDEYLEDIDETTRTNYDGGLELSRSTSASLARGSERPWSPKSCPTTSTSSSRNCETAGKAGA